MRVTSLKELERNSVDEKDIRKALAHEIYQELTQLLGSAYAMSLPASPFASLDIHKPPSAPSETYLDVTLSLNSGWKSSFQVFDDCVKLQSPTKEYWSANTDEIELLADAIKKTAEKHKESRS